MKLVITIDKTDVGFRYENIKSLLSKFRPIEQHKPEIDHLELKLKLEKSEFHELSGGLIWILAQHYQTIPCKKIISYPGSMDHVFAKRHFFESIRGDKAKDSSQDVPIPFDYFIPFRNAKVGYKNIEAEKVYEKAMKNILDTSNEFQGEVSSNILEILNNTFDHSELEIPAGIVCAKEEKLGLLSICAVDMGQGIRSSLMSNPSLRDEYMKMPEEDIIRRVTDFRISCNPRYARHPNYQFTSNGGIGLYYLKLMTQKHKKGQLIIISGKGYYYTDSEGREVKRNFVTERWPGTLVFFRIDPNQDLNPLYREYIQRQDVD